MDRTVLTMCAELALRALFTIVSILVIKEKCVTMEMDVTIQNAQNTDTANQEYVILENAKKFPGFVTMTLNALLTHFVKKQMQAIKYAPAFLIATKCALKGKNAARMETPASQ